MIACPPDRVQDTPLVMWLLKGAGPIFGCAYSAYFLIWLFRAILPAVIIILCQSVPIDQVMLSQHTRSSNVLASCLPAVNITLFQECIYSRGTGDDFKIYQVS